MLKQTKTFVLRFSHLLIPIILISGVIYALYYTRSKEITAYDYAQLETMFSKSTIFREKYKEQVQSELKNKGKITSSRFGSLKESYEEMIDQEEAAKIKSKLEN